MNRTNQASLSTILQPQEPLETAEEEEATRELFKRLLISLLNGEDSFKDLETLILEPHCRSLSTKLPNSWESIRCSWMIIS